MTDKPMPKHETLVRFEGLDAMPAAEPLSAAFKALSEDEIERRAADDPDAGPIPPGFWKGVRLVEAEAKEQITLRLDAEVVRHFRNTGKGYQSRINAVLKSYVHAQDQTG